MAVRRVLSALNAACGRRTEHGASSIRLESLQMLFHEALDRGYRIYAGAIEAPRARGYIAAVVVHQEFDGIRPPREAYREDALACGYPWPTAGEALSQAMLRGREVIDDVRQGRLPSRGVVQAEAEA